MIPDWIDFAFFDSESREVRLAASGKTQSVAACDMESWLTVLCLKNGSTLEGRRKCFSRLMRASKFIPVMVSLEPLFLLIPTGPAKDDSTLWLNYSRIQSAQRKKDRCLITFQDGLVLETESWRRMRQSLSRASLFLLYLHSQSSQ